MARIRSLGLSIWFFLIAVFISGQLLSPFFTSNLTTVGSGIEKGKHFDQADHSSDFFIQPNRSEYSASNQVIRELLFKWKFIQPDTTPDPFTAKPIYSEFIQDSWRCPTVAIILFPHHEFT